MNNSCNDRLIESYEEVFQRTQLLNAFDPILQEQSRELFDYEMDSGTYTPKFLEVKALLGGLQFSSNLQDYAADIQVRIDNIIGANDRYWVRGSNLGVEYLVTKWPEQQSPDSGDECDFLDRIGSYHLPKYILEVKGFQVNPDGCVVLRGLDSGNILETRKRLAAEFEWLPSRQSGWAHIPIGRILGRIDPSTCSELIAECRKSHAEDGLREPIEHLHYVHEKQWYMETREILKSISLS